MSYQEFTAGDDPTLSDDGLTDDEYWRFFADTHHQDRQW